jgi:hypothetical protein
MSTNIIKIVKGLYLIFLNENSQRPMKHQILSWFNFFVEPDSEIFSERFHSLSCRLCNPLAGEFSLRADGCEFYAKRISTC